MLAGKRKNQFTSPHQFRCALVRHPLQIKGELLDNQPLISTGMFMVTVPRAYMFDGKRCRKSLGLEKLAVGRCGLLPLRGTANSPSTLMV